MNEVLVTKYDHEHGHIPTFLREIWKAKHGSDPIEDEIEFYKLESRQATNFVVALSTTCAVLFVILGLIANYCGVKFSHLNAPTLVTILLVDIIVAGVYWERFFTGSPHRIKTWHHEQYFRAVEQLFQAFSVWPSREIGRMSKEQFSTALVGSLKTVARKEVEPKEGFARTAAMDEWKRMHEAALKWKLCSEKYDEFFPSKMDVLKIDDAVNIITKRKIEDLPRVITFLKKCSPRTLYRFLDDLYVMCDKENEMIDHLEKLLGIALGFTPRELDEKRFNS